MAKQDANDEQRETNIQLLLQVQVELGFPNGNGRHRCKSRLVNGSIFNQLELGSFSCGNGHHRYKLRLVKWLTFQSTRARELLVWKWSSQVQVALGKMADFGERKENCRFSGVAA